MRSTLWSVWAVPLMVVAWLCLALPVRSASNVSALAPADSGPDQVVVITMRARAFDPDTVHLTAGQRTKLVFENHDAELHAFVPGSLLNGVHLNIAGNGAPEFGPHGLRRVIIPSNGRAEIRFVPDHPGSYPFLCDMPGHQMQGTIEVQASPQE